jgi:hypothetical protein
MTDPTSLPNFPQPNDEPSLRDKVVSALTELELTPEVDSDGDVSLTYQDQQIFVRATEEGASIVRVFGQWRLQDPVPQDELARLNVCNEVNAAFNLIKTAIARDTLLVTSEHLLPKGADVKGLLAVTLPLLLQGVQLWHQRATGGSLDPNEAAGGGPSADGSGPSAGGPNGQSGPAV